MRTVFGLQNGTRCYKHVMTTALLRSTEQCSLDDWLLAVFAAITVCPPDQTGPNQMGPMHSSDCCRGLYLMNFLLYLMNFLGDLTPWKRALKAKENLVPPDWPRRHESN